MALLLLDLPDEVLMLVINYLMIDDLQNVSRTCQRINQVAHPRLTKHVALKKRYHRLSDPYTAEVGGWLTPLVELLKGHFPAEYVNEVHIAQSEWFWADLPANVDFNDDARLDYDTDYDTEDDDEFDTEDDADDANDDDGDDGDNGDDGDGSDGDDAARDDAQDDEDDENEGYPDRAAWMPCSEDDMQLVIKAVEASPWITQHDACGPFANARNRRHFISEVREGDQDNILAILLPLLPNIRRLYLPKESDADGIPLGSVLGIVNRIACRAALASPSERQDLPLQRLEHVECVRAGVYPYVGRDLRQISYFMALPTVRTLKIGETWENAFEWPEGLPKSHVRHVEFAGGNVQLDAVEGMVEGMVGPCTFSHRRRSRVGPVVLHDSMWLRAILGEDGKLRVVEQEPQERVPLLSRFTRPGRA